MLGLAQYHNIPLPKGCSSIRPVRIVTPPCRASDRSLSGSNLSLSAPFSFAGPLHHAQQLRRDERLCHLTVVAFQEPFLSRELCAYHPDGTVGLFSAESPRHTKEQVKAFTQPVPLVR
jgi:hypothetical protein